MISNLLKTLSQILLLFLLLFQGSLIYVSLSYQGIPIPISFVQKYVPENLNFRTKEILFFLPFHVKLIESEYKQKGDSLLYFNSPEIFLSWKPILKKFNFNNWQIHCFSGLINSKLYPETFELNNLNLTFKNSQIKNASINLQSNSNMIHLKYSSPNFYSKNSNYTETNYTLDFKNELTSFIEQNNSLHSLINAFHSSKNSIAKCHLEKKDGTSFILKSELSIGFIEAYGNAFKSLKIKSKHNSNSKQGIIFFEAAEFHNKVIPAKCSSIKGEIKLSNVTQVDFIRFGSSSGRIKDIKLNTMSGELKGIGTSVLAINGSLFHEDHALKIQTNYKLNAETNKFSCKAYLNLNEFKKKYIQELKALTLKSSRPSFADAEIILDKELKFLSAKGHFQVEPTTINSSSLEYFKSDFRFEDQVLATSNFLKLIAEHHI